MPLLVLLSQQLMLLLLSSNSAFVSGYLTSWIATTGSSSLSVSRQQYSLLPCHSSLRFSLPSSSNYGCCVRYSSSTLHGCIGRSGAQATTVHALCNHRNDNDKDRTEHETQSREGKRIEKLAERTESKKSKSNSAIAGTGKPSREHQIAAFARSVELIPTRLTRRQLLTSSSVTAMTAAAGLFAFITLGKASHSDAVGMQIDQPTAINGRGRTVVLGAVEKSPNDEREYRAVMLGNGMKVLLISDPETKNAAAAMDVHVGHFSDPAQLPGLAHFCEHMLFLGTEKYPDETAYSSYLSEHGGSSNAYTEGDDTCFYFDVNSDYLEGALDRFAQFFISPQFTASATARELNAIESENKKNLQSDGFRLYQLIKSRANPAHPFSKFGTGNKQTLLVDAAKQGIDPREALLEFNSKYYTANQMALCLLGKDSLDQLQKLAEKLFVKVPNRDNPQAPSAEWQGRIPPFLPQDAPEAYKIVPVTDVRKLALAWMFGQPTPESRQDVLATKPDVYIGTLLGHEGPGSLLSYLKSKDWANGLSCQLGESNDDLVSFQVEIDLTSEGLKHTDDVIASLFSYLRMVREEGIPPFVFEETRVLADIGWTFQEKAKPLSLTSTLASNMQDYPIERVISGPVLNDRVNMTLVQNLLEALKPSTPLVFVLAKDFEREAKLKEKWYGTMYAVEDLSSRLPRWSSPPLLKELMLPKPNPFIPRDYTIKATQTRKVKPGDAAIPPMVVQDTSKWRVFLKPDDVFKQPKLYAYFELLTPEVYKSPRSVALLKLFQLSVDDALNEYAYDAQVAGLSYNLDFTTNGLRLAFGGYNDKMPKYIATVAKTIADHVPTDKAAFARLKDIVARELSSFDKQQPYYHAVYNAAALTEIPRFDIEDIRRVLPSIGMKDFPPFLDKCFKRCKGVSLLEGNLQESEASDFIRPVEEAFKFSTLPEEEVPYRQVVDLPLTPVAGAGLVLQKKEQNSDNENSAALVQFQVQDRSPRTRVLCELLATMIEDPFYDSLRTKQQLGYLVFSGLKRVEGIGYLFYLVQSNVADPIVCTDKMTDTVDNFRSQITAMSNEQFDAYVKGLLEQKLEPDQRLAVAAGRDWLEIIDGELNFNRRLEEAKVLSYITQTDLLAFFDTYIRAGGTNRRVFTSQVFANKDVEMMGQRPVGTSQLIVAGGGAGRGSGGGGDDIFAVRDKLGVLPPRVAVSSRRAKQQ